MPAQFNPGDRVRCRRVDALLVAFDGTVWSYGPKDGTYWVIPDIPQPGMVQGCIEAPLAVMQPIGGDTLW